MTIKDLMTSKPNDGESIVNLYKDNYVRIFEKIFSECKALSAYTQTNTPKFPERNLTVNFAEAVKKRFPGTICWYEYQFKKSTEDGQNSNNHLDAVIIIDNEDVRHVLICESKRNFPENGLTGIKDDIARICSSVSIVDDSIIKGEKICSYFGVILLDGWHDDERLRDKKSPGKPYLTKWNGNSMGKEFWPASFKDSDEPYEACIDFNNDELHINHTIKKEYSIKTIMWPLEMQKP